jgi:hypothetical protein
MWLLQRMPRVVSRCFVDLEDMQLELAPGAPVVHVGDELCPVVRVRSVVLDRCGNLYGTVRCSFCNETHCHGLTREQLQEEEDVGRRESHCTRLIQREGSHPEHRAYWLSLREWRAGGAVVDCEGRGSGCQYGV